MTSAFRPHRAGSRRSPEGSRACLARSGDCEPSLGAVGVLRRCCSGGGASLCRKLCRVGHRYRGQHCSRGRCRHRQNNLPPTPAHWRAGRGAAWWRRRGLMRARRAPSCTIFSLAGSVVRCGTRVFLRTIPCKSPSVSRHYPRAGTVVHPRNPSWVATDKDNSLSPQLRAPQTACDDHDTQRRAVKTTDWWSRAGFGTRAVALTSLRRILWPGHTARAARRQRAVFLS